MSAQAVSGWGAALGQVGGGQGGATHSQLPLAQSQDSPQLPPPLPA